MNERLLQYTWQFRYFSIHQLATTDGVPLHIIHPGTYNTNQGPDFLNAKIKIGETTWAGNVELHLRSSDWNLHQHSSDKNYNNVILHVVWEEDVDLGLSFPTLVLQNRVSKLLLKKYEELMQATAFIPCEKSIGKVEQLTWLSWKERLLAERLQHKTQPIFSDLADNHHHWEETFWWLLAKNFGIKVNGDAFEMIARSIPLSLLARHKQQLIQIEALLFGQAGLLANDFKDDYPKQLKSEYQFLCNKYQLRPVQMPLHFLRMRPSNFPTIRLAQLAMLLYQTNHLPVSLREANSVKEAKALLEVTASDYWNDHYVFDQPSAQQPKHLGEQMAGNILLNTVIPAIFAYGLYYKEQSFKNKAIEWMEAIAGEKNTITNGFTALGIPNKTAADSQAMIQLKNMYCEQKRCLECAIGNKIIPV